MNNSKINVVFTAEQLLEFEQKYTKRISELEKDKLQLQNEKNKLLNDKDELQNEKNKLLNDKDELQTEKEKLLNDKDELQKQVIELESLNKLFKEALLHAKNKKFGISSEKLNTEQLGIFNEVELEALNANEETEDPVEEITVPEYKRKKKTKGFREEMLKPLVTQTIYHDLTDKQKTDNLIKVGENFLRYEVTVTPAKLEVIEHYEYVYKKAEEIDGKTIFVKPELSIPVIPNSYTSPSLIAFIIYNKYALSLPLDRQEKMFNTLLGVEFSKQNFANWVILAADRWLFIIYQALHNALLKETYLHADETRVQVLNEVGKGATSDSFMWVYCSGKNANHQIYLYEYQPSRGGHHPREFLNGFSGYLNVDGYAGYNNIPNVSLVGCFAHARRDFVDIVKVLPKDKQKFSLAAIGVKFCNELYSIEHKLADLDADKRYEKRLELSKPVLDEFLVWLENHKNNTTGKLNKAINYCLNQWPKLTRFLEDGNLEIDNNRAERAVKPFVIGRKNWLFSVSVDGANASSICYSIIETAKANNLNPFEYITYLLTELPNMNDKTINDLLPWSDNLPEHIKNKAQ